MNKPFDKILGYANEKKELEQISDIIKNKEAYVKLGAKIPHAFLLHGEPGVGKTLMATCLMEDAGLKTLTIRRDKPTNEFIDAIRETFDEAKRQAPCIILLDDLDKYSNNDPDYPDSEEFATVQACIDSLSGTEVFVIATANNIKKLPKSLLRSGRFDRVMNINPPHGQEAEEIIAHYIQDKKFEPGISVKAIARIMDGNSTAELENTINLAAVYAGYERAQSITMKHFLQACLKTIFDISLEEEDTELAFSTAGVAEQICIHEAGHAVVSEILCPESVSLMTSLGHQKDAGGFTAYYCAPETDPLYWLKSRAVASLGGRVATERELGEIDGGANKDLDQAFEIVEKLVKDFCVNGLLYHGDGFRASFKKEEEQERAVLIEMEKYTQKANEILAKNREFFEKLVEELSTRNILMTDDIQAIKKTCTIVPVTI